MLVYRHTALIEIYSTSKYSTMQRKRVKDVPLYLSWVSSRHHVLHAAATKRAGQRYYTDKEKEHKISDKVLHRRKTGTDTMPACARIEQSLHTCKQQNEQTHPQVRESNRRHDETILSLLSLLFTR